MFESSYDDAARIGSEAAHGYLRGLFFLLCGVGVAVVTVAARRARRGPRPFAPRRDRRLALAGIWFTFIVTVGLFSRVIDSVQPRGYYSGLLGPQWIIDLILLTKVLAVPVAVIVACSV